MSIFTLITILEKETRKLHKGRSVVELVKLMSELNKGGLAVRHFLRHMEEDVKRVLRKIELSLCTVIN